MNYYEILGVQETATDKEIKKAYKALVKKYHPDVFEGNKAVAEQKIKELNEAYDVLSDPDLKKEYDSSLHPEPAIEITVEKKDEDFSSKIPTYEDLYKKDLYERYRSNRFTTNFYGVSRDDLKNEKDKIYSKNKSVDEYWQKMSRYKYVIVIGLGIITLLLMLIILLSAIQNIIESNRKPKTPDGNYQVESPEVLPYIDLDMSFHDIRVLLGTPDAVVTKGDYDYVYYGNSYIVFNKNNKVVDWKNNGAFRSDTYTGSEYRILRGIYHSVNEDNSF